MGISDDEYLEWQSQMKITGLVSLNEYMEQGNDVSQEYGRAAASHFEAPEEKVEKEELAKILGEALELLIESQLHTKALQKMRVKMGNYMGILTDS